MATIAGDLTDILIEKPNFFSKLSYEEKLCVKSKRSRPNLNLKQVDGRFTRHFQMKWYDLKPWLTGSAKKNRLYCFYCLLFSRNDSEWCEIGVGKNSLKNFRAKAKKHECSVKHITSTIKFNELGTTKIDYVVSEAARLSTIKHNERVDQNRLILKRLISTVCFLAKQESSFRLDNESETFRSKGNYLEIIDFLAEQEPHFKDRLIYSNIFKDTSTDIQNDLIACVTEVINEQISREINGSPFVSIQCDETLDVSTKSQLSVILRYANNFSGEIEERFVGFYDITGTKTAESVAKVLLRVLGMWKISQEKLVCQTYDGSSVMSGTNSGVDFLLKQHFPHALFIHCYAHRLNLVFLHCCKSIAQVKLFVANLAGFNSFFSRSSKRSELLIERGFKIPSPSETMWNYHSRSVVTILVYYEQLRLALNEVVENEDWDSNSIHQAEGLINVLSNPKFLFLLNLYRKIFVFTDMLFNILQSNLTDIKFCNREIDKCLAALNNLKCQEQINECIQLSKGILGQHMSDDEIQSKFQVNLCDHLEKVAHEILDTVIVNFVSRFRDFRLMGFFELVDKSKFEYYSRPKLFPETKIEALCRHYPLFDKEKLKGELMFIYMNYDKNLPPKGLFKSLISNGMKEALPEVIKLLSLVLAIPATAASCERSMCTLKRVKSHLRNSMTNERLSNLATLAIEKLSLKMSPRCPEFVSRVIDVFAVKKDKGIDLMYLKVPKEDQPKEASNPSGFESVWVSQSQGLDQDNRGRGSEDTSQNSVQQEPISVDVKQESMEQGRMGSMLEPYCEVEVKEEPGQTQMPSAEQEFIEVKQEIIEQEHIMDPGGGEGVKNNVNQSSPS